MKKLTQEEILKKLRREKYKSLKKLSEKYLKQKIKPYDFCIKWTAISEDLCRQAYEWSFNDLKDKLGNPILNDPKKNFKFSVIALGKLGAGELNFSSDIDLLFIYNSDDGYIKGNEEISIHEFSSKLSNSIINLLSEITEFGFCHRVDADLRPEGKSGPITNSIDAAVNYYQYFGQEWERMALIRAKPVAGDTALGERFIKELLPFIYRKSLDLKSLDRIKETKEKIQKEAKKSIKEGINIKLGEGGIREAEFIVQAIQILNGGEGKKLINRNTIEALKAIEKGKYLPKLQCRQLKDAYIFLRHMENMIQMPDEKQTHIMPSDPAKLKDLALRMGYKDSKKTVLQQLQADYERHSEIIKEQFEYMFQADFEKHEMDEAILTNIGTCENEEEEVDSLPWFKHEEIKRIQFLDLEKKLSIEKISKQLSIVAEVVLREAYKIASKNLREIYGPPISETKNRESASIAIIGMGKLGSREIDYASDLDLMFIYSSDGITAGPKEITNLEYFTKLSQRIISLVTLHTRYGKAYQIDTDLRPSGRSGVLVTSINSFKNYHHTQAEIWERQSLIKARSVAGDPIFCQKMDKVIEELCYDPMLPKNTKENINNLRLRMEKERSTETEKKYNIKLGFGGLMDIDTIVQYLQLKNKDIRLLRNRNTLDGIEALKNQGLIAKEDSENLYNSYLFIKTILSRIRLFSNHASDYLETDSKQLSQISISLEIDKPNELINKYLEVRNKIRIIYNKYLAS